MTQPQSAPPNSSPEPARIQQLAQHRPARKPATGVYYAALVWRAAGRLGIGLEAAGAAARAGLAEFGPRVRFRHPLVRSAAYRSASMPARQEIHAALAQATDPAVDPDQRAWHRAQAAPGPDEDVAAELERSAGRAQARGGLAAAAAFLEHAALLTPEPRRRAQRLVAAARTKRDAGALDEALGLLVMVEAGSLDALADAEVERLRGQIASDQRRDIDAARLLLRAARRFEPVDVGLARETHLEALWEAVMWIGDLGPGGSRREATQAARAAPPSPGPPRPVDVLLDAMAQRFTAGYAAAASGLSRALELFLALDSGSGETRRWLWITGGRAGAIIAMELWDFESWQTLAVRQVQVARDTGALVQLRFAINFLAEMHILRGELGAAARLIEEDRPIAEVTGPPSVAHAAMMLWAWRGQEREAAELIQATAQEAADRGLGMMVNFTDIMSAMLRNGLGQHEAARDAAWRAFEHDHFGFGSLVVPELAEAAARTGDTAMVRAALEWMTERTHVTPTEWALGIEAMIRALFGEGEDAERYYRESIQRLGRTPVRAQLARSRLLYGEWLRRENRHPDARAELRAAYDMLSAMGADAFAERARRELLALGETARRPTAETVSALTPQEAHIARLAADGSTNSEIGAQLFLSARTVEWHLRKVYVKLGPAHAGSCARPWPASGRRICTASDPRRRKHGGYPPVNQCPGPGSLTGAPGRPGVPG